MKKDSPLQRSHRNTGKAPKAQHPAPEKSTAITASAVASDSVLKRQAFPIVGIGASAGGLEAFTQLLKHLPADTGLGFVLVQHLDPQHESALTQLLKRATSMPVQEVTNKLRVEPNRVYVIPPNTNLGIAQGVLELKPRPQNRGAHHPIDAFLESLAQDQRERAIGVILSGTATDGTLGLEAIKAEGGITFAQDDSAKYDSMPRSAVAAGCVDFVLKPENIAKELARIAKHPYVVNASGQSVPALHSESKRKADRREGTEAPLAPREDGGSRTGARQAHAEAPGHRDPWPPIEENGFKKILLLLRSQCGVDFSLYKSTTILRRISRRMVLSKHNTVEDYAQFLRGNTRELDALYSDCLISVTSFFRNPESFELLERKVFPRLLQQRQRDDQPLRVWVLGCSTGQEAYSIAISLQEAMEKSPRAHKLQVFATDLNEALLDKARHGLYSKNVAQEISPELLRRFFVEEDGGYRVIKSLREMVVFARQNFISDPPFSRMDFISCRNLLIYLEPSLQKKALPTFHYALKPDGFLFLGASESISGFTDLFEPVDKKHKIYSRKTPVNPAVLLPVKKERGEHPSPGLRPPSPHPMGRGQGEGQPEGLRSELNVEREADRVLVNQFAPPGVLINADFQILQFRGPTSGYLEPPTGKANFNVLKMAREGLMLPLRATINKAKKEGKTARRENVRVQQNGQVRTVNVEVIPLKNLRDRCFLILVEETKERGLQAASASEVGRAKGTPRAQERRQLKRPEGRAPETARRNAELERELAETRDYLQSIQEQHEAANEELQASNEEVQSANEELQSINEELETTKEELESSNEELITVNDEMANRNTELNRLNSDLVNLQTSTTLGILLLGRDLTIRRFSVQAEKQFNLRATDVGRPIGSVRHNFDLTDLEEFVGQVIARVREHEREVEDKDGRWYSLRVRPYFTLDNKVDGAVVVVVDITDLKHSGGVKAARDYAEATIRTSRDPLIVLRADLRVNTANEAFYKTFNTAPRQTEGRLIFELCGGAWKLPRLRVLLEDILPRNSFFNDFEVTHEFPHIGRRTMLLNARRLDQGGDAPPMILLAIEDVTERQRIAEDTAKLAAIVQTTDDAIHTQTLDGVITSWNPGAERMFGYSALEIVGQNTSALIPSARAGEAERLLETMHQGERVTNLETERARKDGSLLWVWLSLSPLMNAAGQLIGTSLIARDTTERKRTEEKMRRAMEFDDAVMKNMAEGLYTVDDQGLVTYMNPAAEKLFGWSFEELRGHKMHDMTHHHHRDGTPFPAEQCAGLQVLKQGRTLRGQEDCFIRKDGTFFDVTYSSSPLRDGDNVIGLVVVFRDITDQKQSEALMTLQKEAFEKAASGALLEQVLEFLARTAEGQSQSRATMAIHLLDEAGKRFEWTAAPNLPVSYAQATNGVEVSSTTRPCCAAVAHGQRVVVADVATSKKFPAFATLALPLGIRAGWSRPIFSSTGKVLGTFASYYREPREPAPQDDLLGEVVTRTACVIIERKQAEEALRQSQAQLADRAGQLEQIVDERTTELREANNQLEAFIYSIAHDLRRPARTMQGLAHTLLEEYGPALEETGRGYATRIEQSARFMDRLLLDLLDFSRLSNALIPLEPVNLGNLVAEVLRDYQTEIQDRQARVEVTSPLPSVHAHAAALGQVLTNLLTNALKFVAPGVKADIRIRAEEKAGAIRLWVEDNGIGIPAEFHERIFHIFQRLHGTTYPGTGIGLTIVRKGIERMGGHVGVESVPGEGSKFWIELAKVPQDEGAEPLPA